MTRPLEASPRRGRHNVVLTAAIAGLGGCFSARGGAYWIHAAMGPSTRWFCWKFVPETQGKHPADIQAIFQARADTDT